MKLYRRKPEYALAMPVHRTEDSGVEYAVQPCDETGKPLTTHLQFVPDQEFATTYQVIRVRPRAKTQKRNGPTKKTKLKTVNLKDIESEDAYA